MPTIKTCAACGRPAEGNYSIHRDETLEDGTEMPLCDGCGSEPSPTCEELWRMIAKRTRASVQAAGELA